MASKVRIKGEYILVYNMQENDAMRNCVEKIREKNLKIVIVNGGGTNVSYKGKKKNRIGPLEWLWLIGNAKYVVTNSFHGLAFSLIFKKKVYVCEHTTRNLRIENLLVKCGMNEKLIKSNSKLSNIEKFQINGELAFNNIDFTKTNEAVNSILDFDNNQL